MDNRRRATLAAGLTLILIGAGALVVQLVPPLQAWVSWPLVIVWVGVLLVLIGLLTGLPALGVPAGIVGGLGGLLYWQDAAGQWESWAYTWTLIPGFAGVGLLVSALLGGETRKSVRAGRSLILISLFLFTVCGSFFGALGLTGPYWPALLIVLGLLILARSLFRSR